MVVAVKSCMLMEPVTAKFPDAVIAVLERRSVLALPYRPRLNAELVELLTNVMNPEESVAREDPR